MQHDQHSRSALWALIGATAVIRIGYGAIIPTMPVYARELGLSTAMIAAMTNAFLLTNTVLQSLAGQGSDRWGRRNFMLGGIALYTVSAALFVLQANAWFYVLLRALEGAGAAAFTPAARAYLADLVPAEQRGNAYGRLLAADMAGLMLGPLVGGVAQAIGGSHGPFVACALLGVAAFVWLLGAARPATAASSAEVAATTSALGGVTAKAILRLPQFWAVALPGLGFAYLSGMYAVIWALYVQSAGGSPLQVNLSYTLYAMPMVHFMSTFGKVADRVGRPLLVAVGGAVATLAVLGYGLFPIPWVLLTLCFLDGLAWSVFTPANQAFLADMTPPDSRGRFIGLVGSFQTGATILATTWIGLFYESLPPLLLFSIGATAVGFSTVTSVLLMRRTTRQLRL